MIEKDKVMAEIISQLETELKGMEASFKTAKTETIEAEGRMHSRYDTTKTERGWLTDGLSARCDELQLLLTEIKHMDYSKKTRVLTGSLVEVKPTQEANNEYFIMLPAGGGKKITVENATITVITPKAPISRVMLGKTIGERYTAPNTKEYQILSVQ